MLLTAEPVVAGETVKVGVVPAALTVHGPQARASIGTFEHSTAVGDLNADGVADLVILSPTASEPASARLVCGAVYVLFGPSSCSPGSLGVVRERPE